MLFKIALVLLAAWVLGVVGVYDIGELVHVFLLIAIWVLLLGLLRARDAAARGADGGPPDRP